MEVSGIIAQIDSQIAKLQQARGLLLDSNDAPKVGRGRPKKDLAAAPAQAKASAPTTRKKRNLSPDARKRIADAQKKRWAERKSGNG